MNKRAFRPKEAAAYAGLSDDWLKRARIYGQVDGIHGPRFHSISPRLILYYKEDLDEFLNQFPGRTHNAA